MTTSLLIQVVPQLKPTQCGVTDHALKLACELRKSFGVETVFVVLNSTRQFEVDARTEYCAPAELLSTCNAITSGREAAILVHVSGYGYARDGVPEKLAAALEEVKATGRFRIGAYFHELTASDWRPWKSAFWTKPRQRKAVRRIIALCDLVATNSEIHARWIQEQDSLAKGTQLINLAVFSNVGEGSVRETARRDPVLLVFGSPSSRKNAYRSIAQMQNELRKLAIEEILDVGPVMDVPPVLGGIPIRRLGPLPDHQIASLFANSTYGFVKHPVVSLAKSGVLAGYSTYGVIPIVAFPFSGKVDGLQDGHQVLSAKTIAQSEPDAWSRCSQNAYEWYEKHRLFVHASMYQQLLLRNIA